ncbi:hypothetical protein JKP88DRAFT_267108, partial [Tribonema minus]
MLLISTYISPFHFVRILFDVRAHFNAAWQGQAHAVVTSKIIHHFTSNNTSNAISCSHCVAVQPPPHQYVHPDPQPSPFVRIALTHILRRTSTQRGKGRRTARRRTWRRRGRGRTQRCEAPKPTLPAHRTRPLAKRGAAWTRLRARAWARPGQRARNQPSLVWKLRGAMWRAPWRRPGRKPRPATTRSSSRSGKIPTHNGSPWKTYGRARPQSSRPWAARRSPMASARLSRTRSRTRTPTWTPTSVRTRSRRACSTSERATLRT